MNARKIVIPLIVSFLGLIAVSAVVANQTQHHHHEAVIQKGASPAAATHEEGATTTDTLLRYANKTCPITAEPINPKLFYEYKNEESKTYGRIHVCCPACLSSVAKNPQKYYNKAYAEQKKACLEATTSQEVANRICPVMGGETRSDVSIEYNGRKINFCCPACEGKFLKEPGKYLKKLEKE